jgi:EAL domain-containing protein (putative c-di-GMP-specific phosphodiesterase class I)
VIFDASMHAAAVKRLALESDLRRALANREFVLHYQPIMSLTSAQIVGFEALLRWQRGPEDIVGPDVFIPVAEETGLIVFLGAWVLREACRAVATWFPPKASGRNLTMSVNISSRQFAQADFAAQVIAIISAAGIDPASIRLELTESITIENAERAIEVLERLRAFGVRIAIDDFGTGYSSLSYLQRLPLDVLKIDRSFVLAMANDPGSRKIVQTIMSLAQNLGMDVVAEGTETATDVFDLQKMGCQYGQGYFFSRPVPASAAAAMIDPAARSGSAAA